MKCLITLPDFWVTDATYRSNISIVQDFGAIHYQPTVRFLRSKNAQFSPFSLHYAYKMLGPAFFISTIQNCPK